MKLEPSVDEMLVVELDPLRLRGDAAHAAIWETILVSRGLKTGAERSAARRRQVALVDQVCPSDRQYMEVRLRLDGAPPLG